jgi:hypothetical protein
MKREDSLRLDPLEYRPFRDPRKRFLLLSVAVAVLLFLPSLWSIPITHSVSFEMSVGPCGQPPATFSVNIPVGAVFVFEWRSSDGAPVGIVWAPSGPPVTSAEPTGDAFTNSSVGHSEFQGDGSPLWFWACDYAPSTNSSSNRTVDVTGAYYEPLL